MVATSFKLHSSKNRGSYRHEQNHTEQIRIEPELKAQAEAVLSQLGLKPTEYIRVALSQLVLRKGLPFDVRIPNSDTIAALEEPAHGLRRFDSTREVFADLEERRVLSRMQELVTRT